MKTTRKYRYIIGNVHCDKKKRVKCIRPSQLFLRKMRDGGSMNLKSIFLFILNNSPFDARDLLDESM